MEEVSIYLKGFTMKHLFVVTLISAAFAFPAYSAGSNVLKVEVYDVGSQTFKEILKNAESALPLVVGMCDGGKTTVTRRTDQVSFIVATGETNDGYKYHYILNNAGAVFTVEEHDGVQTLLELSTLDASKTHAPNFVKSLTSGIRNTDCKVI